MSIQMFYPPREEDRFCLKYLSLTSHYSPPSANEKKKNERDDEETNAKDEESESDADKYKTPLPRSKKKPSLPFVEGKLRVKRRIKRRRFSSRLSSDEQIETGDEFNISSYTSVKLHHRWNLSSFQSTDFDEDASDDAMKCKDEHSNESLISRTAVYEQQRWEGKIIDGRDAKQGRGRPRKKYRVRWEDSWTDGARLTASGLMQERRERRHLNLGVEPGTFVDRQQLYSTIETCLKLCSQPT